MLTWQRDDNSAVSQPEEVRSGQGDQPHAGFQAVGGYSFESRAKAQGRRLDGDLRRVRAQAGMQSSDPPRTLDAGTSGQVRCRAPDAKWMGYNYLLYGVLLTDAASVV